MNCKNGFYYKVEEGDTLYLISKKYGISVKDILSANPNIEANNLAIGDRICIPTTSECPDDNIYIIKRNDTFFLIAQEFNISYNSLQKANPNSDIDNLQSGDRICIPASKPSKVCPNNRKYLIEEGDTLSSIAERFVVSATDILKLNPNMIPSEFISGRLICLPKEAPV